MGLFDLRIIQTIQRHFPAILVAEGESTLCVSGPSVVANNSVCAFRGKLMPEHYTARAAPLPPADSGLPVSKMIGTFDCDELLEALFETLGRVVEEFEISSALLVMSNTNG
jgi:uncharacterized protein YciW